MITLRRLRENPDGRFQTIPSACGIINVSRKMLIELATEANAIARFGKSVRVDMPVLYKYIDSVCKGSRD